MAHPLLDHAESSTVEGYRAYRIGDEPGGQSSLFVEFKSGSIYRYIVPWDVYLDMKKTVSLGKFVNNMKSRYTGSVISATDLNNLVDSSSAKVVANTRKKK